MVVIDYYAGSSDYSSDMTDVHPTVIIGRVSANYQCFKTPSSPIYKISSCRFYLERENNPVGELVARIYEITGTFGIDAKPTGSALASSAPVLMQNIPISSTWIEFIFSGSNKITLAVNHNYAICLEVASASFIGTLDDILFWIDTTTSTHQGNGGKWSGNDGGAWIHFTNGDCLFYVYGEQLISIFSIKRNLKNRAGR